MVAADREGILMNELEIDYRGYVIRFSENQEIWRCWALDFEGEKISTVKRKIDKIIAASRKLPIDRSAIYVDYHNVVKEVRVVAFVQPRKAGAEPDSVWCLVPDKERYFDHEQRAYAFRDVQARKKISLSMIFADTPENRAIFIEIERLISAKRQIDEHIGTEKAAATGVTLIDLQTDGDDEG